MKGHLQLHFSSADLSDEAVLGVYPTTIRQRILRHLYSSPVASCWLFRCVFSPWFFGGSAAESAASGTAQSQHLMC